MSLTDSNEVVFTPVRLLLSRGLRDAGCAVRTFSQTQHFVAATHCCHSAAQHRPTTSACCQLVCQWQPSALMVLKFGVDGFCSSKLPSDDLDDVQGWSCKVMCTLRTETLHEERVSMSFQRPSTKTSIRCA